MTDTAVSRLKNAIPSLTSRKWTVLLVASLMLNLLVLGLVAGSRFGEHGFGKQGQQSIVQLIPRQFFEQLPRERRRELMQAMRGSREDFQVSRQQNAAAALELAAALENPNYDANAVTAVIEKFATGRESFANKAAQLVEKILEKLTAVERTQLASAIRDRNAHDWKRN